MYVVSKERYSYDYAFHVYDISLDENLTPQYIEIYMQRSKIFGECVHMECKYDLMQHRHSLVTSAFRVTVRHNFLELVQFSHSRCLLTIRALKKP